MIQNEKCATYTVNLCMAGPMFVAEQIIRRECFVEGLCVTLTPTKYIYTGGEEVGYIVGFINYPRFPKQPEEIYNRARDLLVTLIKETYQKSGTIVATDKTEFISLLEK